MKISKKYLRKLILETLEEIFVPGKETDTFVDAQTGEVKATAPKITKVPKIKYVTTDEKFLNAFAPIVSLSQEKVSAEEGINLRDLLRYVFIRKDTRDIKKLASEFNAEYEKIGAKFSKNRMTDIIDVLRAEEKIKNTDDIIARLNTLNAETKVSKYVPDENSEVPFKTANYKGPAKNPIQKDPDLTEPDFTPPWLKESKKFKIKYKCN